MTRDEWCTALAKLVSPAFPEEAQVALLDMLPAMEDLSDDLFTAETMIAVARSETRQSVPSLREITTVLGQHRGRIAYSRRLAAPPNADLPPDRQAPLPEEVAYVARLLTGRTAEVDQRENERLEREPAARLPDVSLKGEALRLSRERRGIQARR